MTWDLSTVTSCIGLSVRIVTKSPKVGPLLIFSISLPIYIPSCAQENDFYMLIHLEIKRKDRLKVRGRGDIVVVCLVSLFTNCFVLTHNCWPSLYRRGNALCMHGILLIYQTAQTILLFLTLTKRKAADKFARDSEPF